MIRYLFLIYAALFLVLDRAESQVLVVDNGTVLSEVFENGGIYTYSYTVSAKPYSNRKLTDFNLILGSSDDWGTVIFNPTSEVGGSTIVAQELFGFTGLMIMNQSTVTFTIDSASGPILGLAEAFDSQTSQFHPAYVPQAIPEPRFFLLISLGGVLLLRRSR
ncbi:hypothetical protein N9955_00455 [bacterium]|nr:hypothetical protein [bacterium]